jgi:DNA gyrase/topoisomerase IV subunit A
MDQTLPRLYKEYGEYSNYRNFPLDLDGLKPVERRVLVSAYKIARAKFVKSRQVDAYTIGHYHPHGECYGTIVQLVRQGFLIGQGNFGSNVGVEPTGPAAPRYTECRIAQSTIDLAFKYIKYVPEIPTEMGDIEPAFLPTMIPLCLIGSEYTQGIGFGYKTYIPCYTFKSLKDRLLWLLGHRKTEPIPVPISDCIVTASPADLKKLLTKGKNRINVEGIIEENPKQNMVVLKSWPPGKRFETILGKFQSEMESGMIGFTDLSAVETNIVFQVLRERNRDKIYNDFVAKLKDVLKGAISFEITVVDVDNKVLVKSVDDLLMDTYNMFSGMAEKMLTDEVARITNVIEEYNLLEVIRPTLSECIGRRLNVEDTLQSIKDTHKMKDIEPVKQLISNYKINKLLTLEMDTNELNIQKKQLLQTLTELDKFLIDQYSTFK